MSKLFIYTKVRETLSKEFIPIKVPDVLEDTLPLK
ncbi:hypothetical protein AQAU111925_12090 [Aquirufa aurantiipilula]